MTTFSNPLGGYVSEVVSISCEGEGGVAGGVSNCWAEGCGPGEQNGICLLGIGAGVPRCEVLMVREGGGVAVRPRGAGLVVQIVAIYIWRWMSWKILELVKLARNRKHTCAI